MMVLKQKEKLLTHFIDITNKKIKLWKDYM